MRGLMQKFAMFMQGRYGSDQLNISLMVLFFVIWIVNVFVFNSIASLVLSVLEIVIIAITLFRSFSRNITKRSAENRAFLPVYNAVTGWFKLTHKKFRDRKDYRYIKCPMCKSQLRVKNNKGKHTVRCPRCSNEFQKKIF